MWLAENCYQAWNFCESEFQYILFSTCITNTCDQILINIPKCFFAVWSNQPERRHLPEAPSHESICKTGRLVLRNETTHLEFLAPNEAFFPARIRRLHFVGKETFWTLQKLHQFEIDSISTESVFWINLFLMSFNKSSNKYHLKNQKLIYKKNRWILGANNAINYIFGKRNRNSFWEN